MGNLIESKTQVGRSIRVGDLEIVPLVRKVRLQPPDYRGTLLWGTPEALIVQSDDGKQEVLPIHDHTRRAQVILLGIGLLGSLLIWLALLKTQN